MEKYFDMLKINNYNIIGSFVKSNRDFYGDIDLEEVLDDISITEFIKRVQENIKQIKKSKDVFFLDFKAGVRNGLPVKWNEKEIMDGFRYIDNQKIILPAMLVEKSIVKLDVVVLTKKLIMPISINYWLYKNEVNKENFKADLLLYANYLKKKGDMVDYVKKMSLYYALIKDTENEKKMIEILNSDIGLIYTYIGFLENISLLLKSKNNDYSIENIYLNLNNIYKKLPKKIRYIALPLVYIREKERLVDTLKKVINGLNSYVNTEIKNLNNIK